MFSRDVWIIESKINSQTVLVQNALLEVLIAREDAAWDRPGAGVAFYCEVAEFGGTEVSEYRVSV